MERYIKTFATSGDVQTAINNGELIKPYVAYIEDEDIIDWNSKSIDYSNMPLTFKILSGGTINIRNMSNYTSYYSINNSEFTPLNRNNQIVLNVNQDDLVVYKISDWGSYMFSGSTAMFNIYGNLKYNVNNVDRVDGAFANCTGLVDASNLILPELYGSHTFANMFNGCSSLTTAPELPATTLITNCYSSMFAGCSSLTTAPDLPATILADYCYRNMFDGCWSLTTAPELPATTLAEGCYNGMFRNCWSLTAPELPATTLALSCYQEMFFSCLSLTTAPELPATTLAIGCYTSMFSSCFSLTTAPELPATTLAISCYSNMFQGCTALRTAPSILPATTLVGNCYNGMFRNCFSLTTAPELPATTLAQGCYQNMFSRCNLLNYIKCLATDISASNCTYNWVDSVSSTGTFVKNPNMSGWTTGSNGIPNNWTVIDA